MSSRICAIALIFTGAASQAQVASHSPVVKTPTVVNRTAVVASQKTVVRVNGAALTDRDLLREMYAIFPYAQQHDGFPKSMEADIRKGALDMIIFEELVYQEAKRTKVTIPAQKLAVAESRFRKQFPSDAAFQGYLRAECNGSTQGLREKIRRSLLIEQMLRSEVTAKSKVSLAEAKSYYDKSPKQFEHGETFSIQTISVLPPEAASGEIQKDAQRKAEAAVRLAKATKSYEEFGRLAEQISDDDWHVNKGDRKAVDRSKLPPEVIKVALAMKIGQVSDIIQLGRAYTIVRLNGHSPAGKTPFAYVKAQLQADMQKEKTQLLRSALGDKLRKSAKIEVM
jgi:peptidyl-prolyl cis-trans isomerase SurA